MRGKLTVYFQRPPIGYVPFPIGRMKDLGLLPRSPKEGAVAVGMDLHVVRADEVEPVPASHVMKGVVREFELLGSGAKRGNGRGEFQISAFPLPFRHSIRCKSFLVPSIRLQLPGCFCEFRSRPS